METKLNDSVGIDMSLFGFMGKIEMSGSECVATLTMNPCYDKSVVIDDEIKIGGLNRTKTVKMELAGKGFNVSRGFYQLNYKTIATGICKVNGNDDVKKLKYLEEGKYIVNSDKEPRINMKVFSQKTHVLTEFNESGNVLKEEEIKLIKKKVAEIAKRNDVKIFVMSGSLPPSCNPGFYKELINEIKADCDFIVLDTSGEPLIKAIDINGEMPDIIKPNLVEFETIVGKKYNFQNEERVDVLKQIKEDAKQFIDRGIKIICITLGSEGSLCITKEKCYCALPIEVEVKGTVAAGDSFIVGFCTGIIDSLEIEQCFKRAVASATSAVVQEGSEVVRKELLDFYMNEVKIEQI